MMMLAVQATPISMDSYISIAVLIVVTGFVWRIATVLTEIKLEIRRLKYVPSRLKHIEDHLLMFEEDVNNLFGAVRSMGEPASLLSLTRRSKFRPLGAAQKEDEGE